MKKKRETPVYLLMEYIPLSNSSILLPRKSRKSLNFSNVFCVTAVYLSDAHSSTRLIFINNFYVLFRIYTIYMLHNFPLTNMPDFVATSGRVSSRPVLRKKKWPTRSALSTLFQTEARSTSVRRGSVPQSFCSARTSLGRSTRAFMKYLRTL